jgi:hypothetical protein
LDEAAVVSGEAEESMKGSSGTGVHPISHRMYLLAVHHHAISGHNMAQVRDGRDTELALGLLEAKLMTAKGVEN